MTGFAIKREHTLQRAGALAKDFAATHRAVLDDGESAEVFNAALTFAKANGLTSASMARVLVVLLRRSEITADIVRSWVHEAPVCLGERAMPDLPDRVLNTEVQVHAATTTWEHRQLAGELHQWFERFNQTFFGNALPPSAISIERDDRRVLGWYQYVRDGLGLKYRININALYVGRPRSEVLETLLHEMIHEWEETELGKNRGGSYHSRAFRDKAARLFGVAMDTKGRPAGPLPKYSPFALLLGKAGISLHTIDAGAPSGGALDPIPERPASRSRLAKWTCGCTSVWASRGVDVGATCDRCHEAFRRAG